MISELLGAETDKTGAVVKISSTPQIGMSPVCAIYLKSYSELIDAGHAYPRFNGTNKTKAIYATIDDEIVGFIAYEFIVDWMMVHIVFSRVDPRFRNRGIYKLMFIKLEKMAKALKYTKIYSEVSAHNTGIIAGHESVGMKTMFLKNEKDIL
jgi:ribosomal protein S18 acetylase RimI-like enzyme